jgi:hypothetical protein
MLHRAGEEDDSAQRDMQRCGVCAYVRCTCVCVQEEEEEEEESGEMKRKEEEEEATREHKECAVAPGSKHGAMLEAIQLALSLLPWGPAVRFAKQSAVCARV